MEPNSISKPRTSVSAIASLVCGLLVCIPFVTGLAAIILGFVGIKKTSNPQVTGKGLAIAGLILGVLSLGGWSAVSVGAYVAYQMTAPVRELTEKFTRDLSEGKIDEALALSVEGTDRAALVAASDKMKPWGAFQSIVITQYNLADTNGSGEVTVGGPAMFATASKTYTMTLKKTGTEYKVSKFDFP